MTDLPTEAEILTSEVAFHGRVWDIRSDRLRFADAEFTREYLAHSGAVAILAEDATGRVLLINQYRHPIRSRDWELPAGLLDVEGEAPLEAAKRELSEEVDLEAEHWEVLLEFASSPGGSNERIHLFLARGLRAQSSGFSREEEEAEIVPRWVSLEEAVAAVLDGRLHNSILALGVLALHARRG
ncbi:MAG: NUDIX hydrolase [Micrococcales bacterium]|nr:NUDIX hydrolase [Micrococcales bacterium]